MMNLAEYRSKSACLADFLPWVALVGEGVVLNKDGSLQRTARFRGPDLDSATPAELVRTMRDAFAKTIQDPELAAESKKAKFDLEYLPGDEAQKILVEVLQQPQDIVAEFGKYIKFGE